MLEYFIMFLLSAVFLLCPADVRNLRMWKQTIKDLLENDLHYVQESFSDSSLKRRPPSFDAAFSKKGEDYRK